MSLTIESSDTRGDPMTHEEKLEAELNRAIAFQKRWRRITSFSYFAGASLSVVSAILATLLGGFGDSQGAAIAAAFAAGFTSLEKVLLFREKWSHHRSIEVALEGVRLDVLARNIDEKGMAQRMKELLTTYSARLPISGDLKSET
jgi:hypothetical protein